MNAFRDRTRRKRRGLGRSLAPREFPIAILPNLFTTGNLFCGFYACLKAFQGNYVYAAYLILAGCLFDLVDGRVARMTHSSTAFGMEYDSICDVITFGIAPATIAYYWALQPFGRIGFLVAFLFLACGAMRLARFNVQAIRGENEKGYFRGLPIPMAASTVATSVLFHDSMGLKADKSTPLLAMVFVLAYFMVSSVRFKSFKDMELKSRHGFSKLVAAVLIFIGIAAEPDITMFVAVMIYIGLNLLMHFWRMIFRRSSVPVATSSSTSALPTPPPGSTS